MSDWERMIRKKKQLHLQMACLMLDHQENLRSITVSDAAPPIRSKAKFGTLGNPLKEERNHLSMHMRLKSSLFFSNQALKQENLPVWFIFCVLFRHGRVETPFYLFLTT